MTTKLLLASLVLGSSTLAMAAPATQVTVTENAAGTTTVIRDHRGPVIWHGPAYPTITLAADRTLINGRAVIDVGRQAGRFATLTVAADGGRTYVQRVVVKFADGERQVMNHVDRTLVGSDALILDLHGDRRAIASVAVFGRELDNGFRAERGAFRLSAS